ncbi:glycosyltransferase [Pseudodesulfovibrio cashew]|uniref:Glycosyltransferase n=1 Tax=Pseudodesulfovibrio cashew TaxID=2678688 RepID=A0A6I6JDL8_9BACT|nr:glycosyltransferase [Pseudodesulfovibrio cashew]QGY39170.1 glycosyltransferase [Pseudodesulfovibrio cashew]
MARRISVVIASWNGAVGGTEQHVSFLLDRLSRQGYEMQFVVVNRPQVDKAFAGVNTSPVVLEDSIPPGPFSFLRRVSMLAGLFRESPPDLILAYFPEGELVATIAASLAGVRGRLIGNRRNMGHDWTPRSVWQARIISRLVPRFLSNSVTASAIVGKKEWIDPVKISVIPNPINLRGESPGADGVDEGLPDAELIVGIVASVKPVKNHTLFLDAAALIHGELPDVRFVIVGRALPDREVWLREAIAQRGLNGVVYYLGECQNPLPLIRGMSIGVLSSRSEGLSNALVEYAAMGIPAVATDVGGNGEVVVDGETGFLVPSEDASGMAESIRLLLENESMRKEMGQAARSRAAALFAEDVIVNRYLTYFDGALARTWLEKGEEDCSTKWK